MSEHSPCFEAISGLKHLPSPMFQRLLGPHASALAGAGVDVAGLDAMGLWAARAKLPSALVDTLNRIHDMSDEPGYDQLVAAAGGPLFVSDGGPVPALAFAAKTLLERPDLFARAHGRRYVEALRSFREFVGRAELAPPPPSDAALGLTSARLSAFFARRGRSEHCVIRPWEEKGNLHFLVSHGRTWRVDGAVREYGGKCEETTVEWRPQQHDLVVFDARTSRLRVSAPDAPTLQEYVAGFGELLFGDPCWFGDGDVVSLDPLVRARAAVLCPTRGLLEVRLVTLEVGRRSDHSATITYRGDDVFRTLDEMEVDPGAHGPLRQARLRLRLASGGRWRSVTVGVPNRVTGDWRHGDGVVRRYLEERGFLGCPGALPAAEVA